MPPFPPPPGDVFEISSSPFFRERGWRSTSQRELTQVAVNLLILIGTFRLIWSDANSMFPCALSSLPGEALPARTIPDQIAPFGLRYKTHISRNL
jgi:hypothetical protein